MQERGIPRTRDALYGLVIGPRCRKRPTPDFVDDPRRRERRFAGRGENERAEWAHVGRDRDQIHEVAGLTPSGSRHDLVHRKVGLMVTGTPIVVPYEREEPSAAFAPPPARGIVLGRGDTSLAAAG